jgi:phytoene/squalene synthetase
LHLFGYSDEKMMLLSDKICSGLQLANFWQDIAVDLKKPRVYLPKDEMRQFQYTMTELQNLKYNQAFRQLLTFQIDRTELMLRQGTELIDHLHGRLKIEIKCTCLGGLMVLKKIRQLHYDTLHQRPVLAKVDKLKILYLGLRRGETWKNL